MKPFRKSEPLPAGQRGGIERCGVCGGQTGDLQAVRDKRGNTGYFCRSCEPLWRRQLLPDSTNNFFLCSECGFKIFASGPVDRQGRCAHCGGNLDLTFCNLVNDQPQGKRLLT